MCGVRLLPHALDGSVRRGAAHARQGRTRARRGPRPRGAVLLGADPQGARVSEKLRLGGMALRNGLLVHGPTHWAAAVRTNEGEVKVASGRKPELGSRATERLPGVRGVTKLAEAFVVIPLVKRHLPEARLPMQDARTLGAMGGATLVGRALRAGGGRTLVREAAVASI